MRQVAIVITVAAAAAFIGCDNPSKPSNKTPNPAPSKGDTPTATPAAAGPGIITPENTTITFIGSKPGQMHHGGFKSFSGSVKPPAGDVTAATLTVEIDTESLYADDPKLTNHLKSPDFFDVKKYPRATFVSTAIKAEKKDDNTHVITGDLTLHGTKKELTIPAKITADDDLLTIDSTCTFDRTEFGIAFAPDKVDKTVTVKVSAKLPRK
jgi:polyisoprenoid-binding protein YceI